MLRLFLVILSYFILQSAIAADTAPNIPIATQVKSAEANKTASAQQKSYFQSLFDEVEVAKTTPPKVSSKQLYDKLSKDSVAYGVLKEYPNLQMGDITFRPISPTATHKPQILQGQEMIRKLFSTDKPRTFRNVTDIINSRMTDPNSPIKDMDWILMSNAFRTMQAPGKTHEAHLLGDLLAEYILLAEIKKQESKPNLTNEDRSFLSTLYYDLSQVYKALYKNEGKQFKEPKNGRLNLPIAPIYRDYAYPAQYDQGYNVVFGDLVGRHLDLLGNSLLFDPYDDLGWAQLIDFALFDLIDPWYYDEFYPEFWYDYFPAGITVYDFDRIRRKWHGIHHKTKHFKHLRQNGAGMNRALRKFSRVASPKSRLNLAIHKELTPSSLLPSVKRERDRSMIQGRAFASRAFSVRTDGMTKSQRKESKSSPLMHQQSRHSYRDTRQYKSANVYNRAPVHVRGSERKHRSASGDTSFKYREAPKHFTPAQPARNPTIVSPPRASHSSAFAGRSAASASHPTVSAAHPSSAEGNQGNKKRRM